MTVEKILKISSLPKTEEDEIAWRFLNEDHRNLQNNLYKV